jgi:hypothetical protein
MRPLTVNKSKVAIAAGAVFLSTALAVSFILSTNADLPQVAIARNQTWTFDCEFLVQRPEQIMLTCADGGIIVNRIKWQSWNEIEATGSGIYAQNICKPNCAEGARADVPVTVRLREVIKFTGRNVLRALDIEAASGRELPNGNKRISWDVSEFAVGINSDSTLP